MLPTLYALDTLTTATRVDPNSAAAHFTLGTEAQEIEPNNGGILDTLGFVHYRRGEYQKAEPILKHATELETRNATIFYHLGMTYYKLGRRAEAASALRHALHLEETIPRPARSVRCSPSSSSRPHFDRGGWTAS